MWREMNIRVIKYGSLVDLRLTVCCTGWEVIRRQ